MRSYPKQPSEQKDVDVDFSPWLPATDTITTMVAESVQIAGVTDSNPLAIASVQYQGITGKVWLKQDTGADGCDYRVTATVSTAGGRVLEQEFRVRVKDKK